MSTVLEPALPAFDPDDIRLGTPDDWAPSATRRGQRQLKGLIALSGLAAIWYLSWLLQPGRVGNPWLYGLLVAAEVFNVSQAIGFWWTLTGRRRGKAERLRAALPADTEVDVFIPTYSEPVEVVEATVARAVALTGYRAKVWVLDDGDRPAMAELADRWGAGYITREVHSGAKAGNINHALTVTDAPFVAVLDCDHVPLEHFLEATLPDFADERVAFVQTPQYYANHRESPIAGASWSQQAIFFGAIAQAKDRHDAMFCTGTNVVFRREALESVGGFPTNSLTEDFELSVHLHEEGWKSTYVGETLAQGLGPEDMASYVSQQHRWARGCLSALPRVLTSRLPLRKRLQFLLSSTYFFSGFTVLVYMSLPLMALLFGVQPLAQISSDQFLLHFAPYYGLCLYTLVRAGQGSFNFSAFALASASFWIHMHACYRWLLRRPSRFVVTPKQGSAARQPRAVAPALVVIALLVGASVFGLARDMSPGTVNNVGFAFLHICVLAAGVWPALVKGQGKRVVDAVEPVVDLRDGHTRPQLTLITSSDVDSRATA